MNSMIIQSKNSKKFWTQSLTVGLKKNPIWICRAQKAHAPCAFNFCASLLCTNSETTKNLRLDHRKLKILKKFPKIKASISSCDLKLIFFSLLSTQIKI